MKKILALSAATFLVVAANAQVASTESQTIKTQTQTGYNRIYVGYTPTTFRTNDKDWDFFGVGGKTAEGLTVGYLRGHSIANQPLYFEWGLNLKYNRKSYTEKEYSGTFKETTNFLNVNVPLNFSYKFNIGNSGFSIAPYLGIHFTVNALAKGTATYERAYSDPYSPGNNNNSWDVNYFSNNSDDDYPQAKRFQLGWQAGVGFNYKALYLGVGYSAEFMKYIDSDGVTVSTGGLTLNLGVNF